MFIDSRQVVLHGRISLMSSKEVYCIRERELLALLMLLMHISLSYHMSTTWPKNTKLFLLLSVKATSIPISKQDIGATKR